MIEEGKNRILVVIAPEQTGSEADAILGPSSGDKRISMMRTLYAWEGPMHLVHVNTPSQTHDPNPIRIVTEGSNAKAHFVNKPASMESILAMLMPLTRPGVGEVVLTGAWSDPENNGLIDQLQQAMVERGIPTSISDCCFTIPSKR